MLRYAFPWFLFSIFAVQDALKNKFHCIIEVNINTCHPYFVNKGSGPFQKHIGRFLRNLRIRLVQYRLVQLSQVDTGCLLRGMSHSLADNCHRDILPERLGSP